MPDLRSALSDLKESFKDLKTSLNSSKKSFLERIGYRQKKYLLKRRIKNTKHKYWDRGASVYIEYVLFEFAPNAVAYGFLLNIPAVFFLEMVLTPLSVAAFGCLWYMVFVELPDAVQQMIPYVKVKVDN